MLFATMETGGSPSPLSWHQVSLLWGQHQVGGSTRMVTAALGVGTGTGAAALGVSTGTGAAALGGGTRMGFGTRMGLLLWGHFLGAGSMMYCSPRTVHSVCRCPLWP